MKKKLLALTMAFSIVLLFGCQKQLEETKVNLESQAGLATADKSGGCRMTNYMLEDQVNNNVQMDKFSYKNGLLDEWTAFWGVIFKLNYNQAGKLIRANIRSIDGEALWDVDYIWEKGKVVHEYWYLAGTDILDDEGVVTYNALGQLEKYESLYYNYYSIHVYDSYGRLANNQTFLGGQIAFRADYAYTLPMKNPFKSLRDVPYGLPYSNAGFGVHTGDRWYSSEKVTFYDVMGNASIIYEQADAQTLWTKSKQNYPELVDYTDMASGGKIFNAFEFENCGPDASSKRHLTSSGSRKTKPSLMQGLYQNKMTQAKMRIKALKK